MQSLVLQMCKRKKRPLDGAKAPTGEAGMLQADSQTSLMKSVH